MTIDSELPEQPATSVQDKPAQEQPPAPGGKDADTQPVKVGLGEKVAQFDSKKAKRRGLLTFLYFWTLALVVLLTFAIGFITATMWQSAGSAETLPAIGELAGMLVMPLIAWLVVTRLLLQAGQSLELHRHGIQIKRWVGKPRAILWKEMDGITLELSQRRLLGWRFPVGWDVWVYPLTGKPVHLPGDLKDMPEAVSRLKAGLYPRRMPRYRQALRAGETLHFKMLDVHAERLSLTPGGKTISLPWDEVKEARVEGGQLRIRDINEHIYRLPVGRILNLELLLELIKQDIYP